MAAARRAASVRAGGSPKTRVVPLPQFAASFGSSRTQSTFSGAEFSGLNQFNLRNLGAQRTLTLINGRRAPGGRTVSTGIDFNLIPTANIERFELVTGGASAVYGADAVTGVVNLITRKDFDGLEFGANYSETKDSDNKSPGGYAMFGKQWDRGHVMLTAEYQKQGDSVHASVTNPLDDGSFIYAVRTAGVNVGETRSDNRYFRPDKNPVVLTGLRRDTVTVGAGTFATTVIRPTIRTSGIFSDDGQAQVWFTDDASRYPVQVKAKFSKFTLTLSLESVKHGVESSALPALIAQAGEPNE